jgi:hypothetical protein
MYTVSITEHLEDWYVADEITGEFATFGKTLCSFAELCLCKNLLNQEFSSDGIDEYISENFQDVDDKDYRTHSIVGVYLIELNVECLTSEEVLKMHHCLTAN